MPASTAPTRSKSSRYVLPMATAVFALGVIACTTLAHSQPLDLQEKCASQARKTFEELEIEKDKTQAEINELLGGKPAGSTYQSHYNTKLKRCLVLIERSNNYPVEKMGID